MLIPLIALLALRQTPKTFEDLELEKIKAYHAQKTFSEELELKSTDENGKVYKVLRTTLMDGDRSHIVAHLPDHSVVESFDDGKNSCVIMYSKKLYLTSTSTGAAFDPKSALIKADPDHGNMALNGELPYLIATNPTPEIKSIETVHENGETLRKVEASATNSVGHTTKITEWFLPDLWILKHAIVEGIGKDGPFKDELTVSKLDFHAKVREVDFAFDPSKVQGFQRVDPNGNPLPPASK